jgi:pimeloyl-ACP methyl ester carboxylesterase
MSKTRALTCVLAILLLAGIVPAAAQEGGESPSPIGVFRKTACFFDLPRGAVEGKDIECGYVTVPERHANPDGPVIELAVAVVKSTSAHPAPDPLVIEAGGPGVPSLISVPGVLRMTQFRAERDIVIVEQRGIGDSVPNLGCEAGADFAVAMYGQNPDDADLIAQEREVIADCYQQWVDQGIDLSAYNSLENAADFPVVMDALGYDQFNFYGVSYASALGQHIMRDYPERLRSVVLDSVVPLDVSFMTTYPVTIERAFNLLFDGCAADPVCGANFPDLEARFFALVDDYNANQPVMTFDNPFEPGETVDAEVRGAYLVLGLYQQLYDFGANPLLPASIFALSEGTDTHFIESYVMPTRVTTMRMVSGMSNSVLCSEFENPEAALQSAQEHPELDNMLWEYLDFEDVCAVWPVERLPDYAFEPVTSDVPTLLISGQFDPVTPPENAEVVAAHLSHSYVYTFPGLGHAVFGDHQCPLTMVLDFVNDPSQPPDSGCIDDLRITFAASLGLGDVVFVPVTVDEIGVAAVAPEDWTLLDVGVYVSPGYTTLLAFGKDTGLDATREILSRFDPDPIEEIEINGRVWAVHEVVFEGVYEGVLAVTPTGAGDEIYVVLLVTTDNVDQVKDAILGPVLDAFDVVD